MAKVRNKRWHQVVFSHGPGFKSYVYTKTIKLQAYYDRDEFLAVLKAYIYTLEF